jgi:hypothetical protein
MVPLCSFLPGATLLLDRVDDEQHEGGTSDEDAKQIQHRSSFSTQVMSDACSGRINDLNP